MLKNITCNEFYIKLITNLSVHVMASFFRMSMFDPEFIFMGRHCASLQKTTILPRFFTFTLQIIIRDREKLKKNGEQRWGQYVSFFSSFSNICVFIFLKSFLYFFYNCILYSVFYKCIYKCILLSILGPINIKIKILVLRKLSIKWSMSLNQVKVIHGT